MATAVDRKGWGLFLFFVVELIGAYFMFRVTIVRKKSKRRIKDSENIK